MPNQQSDLDLMFHALSDRTRRGMVERLTRGPATVGELAQPLTMSLPSVLQHLQLLEKSGLVTSQKAGRVRTCYVQPAALTAVEAWIKRHKAMWEGHLDRLADYLDETKEDDAP